MSPTSYSQALSSLTRVVAQLKSIPEVPKRQVVTPIRLSFMVYLGLSQILSARLTREWAKRSARFQHERA